MPESLEFWCPKQQSLSQLWSRGQFARECTCSLQPLCQLGGTCPHWGQPSPPCPLRLMLIYFGNTLTDIPKITLCQVSRYSSIQPSRHLKVTITTFEDEWNTLYQELGFLGWLLSLDSQCPNYTFLAPWGMCWREIPVEPEESEEIWLTWLWMWASWEQALWQLRWVQGVRAGRVQ